MSTNPDLDALQRYFQKAGDRQEELRASKPTDSRLRLATKNLVPIKFRGTARMVLTGLLSPRERRKAAEVEAKGGPLRLHLGSGGEHKDGWINIDLLGDPVEISWDLARGIPFGDNSVEAIFHEHLLEHIPLEAGAHFMTDCFRVLKPGGILRVAVPDAGALTRSYAGDGEYLERLHPDRPTRMLAMQELFYWHRHTTMYDADTLALLFRAAGFANPVERTYQDTDLELIPDTPKRAAQSLYMEAQHP